MAPIFPRTTLEFLKHGRVVVLHCVSGCGHRAPQDPESLILTFGEDFDLIARRGRGGLDALLPGVRGAETERLFSGWVAGGGGEP